MWKIIFCIGLFNSGAFAMIDFICNPKKCEDLKPQITPGDPELLFPTADQLRTLCPSIMPLVHCVKEEVQNCLGQELDYFLDSDNETISAVANVVYGISGIFNDICDERTDFYKVYVRNAECIKGVAIDPMRSGMCALEARTLYGAFSYLSDEKNKKEEMCMIVAHVIACVSADILQDCGEEARDIFIGVMKRSRLMKYAICTVDDFTTLKNNYIDFLELGDDRRSVFEKAFELKKRK